MTPYSEISTEEFNAQMAFSLKEIEEILTCDRSKTHGNPAEMFVMLAELWSAYLRIKVEPHETAVMLNLLKVARTKHGAFNPDDYADMNGYGTIGKILARLRDNFNRSTSEKIKKVFSGVPLHQEVQ